MRKLSNQELLEKYHNSIKEDYPDMTYEHLREIVSTPFNMLKEEMSKGNLSTVRLKYLGTFLVYKNRAKGLLSNLTERFKMHKIDKKEYFETKKMIDDYVEKTD